MINSLREIMEISSFIDIIILTIGRIKLSGANTPASSNILLA